MKEFEDKYFISEEGRVFSSKGKNGSIRELVGKVTKCGYRQVLITVGGERRYINVHRIVAENFIKKPKGKEIVNHINGDKLDNRVENLEWCNHEENLKHARDNGLLSYCKITPEIAEKIKMDKGSHRALAKKYGIGKTQVGYIKNGKRWSK